MQPLVNCKAARVLRMVGVEDETETAVEAEAEAVDGNRRLALHTTRPALDRQWLAWTAKCLNGFAAMAATV